MSQISYFIFENLLPVSYGCADACNLSFQKLLKALQILTLYCLFVGIQLLIQMQNDLQEEDSWKQSTHTRKLY